MSMMPSQKFGMASPSTENVVAAWSGQRRRLTAAITPAGTEISTATLEHALPHVLVAQADRPAAVAPHHVAHEHRVLLGERAAEAQAAAQRLHLRSPADLRHRE